MVTSVSGFLNDLAAEAEGATPAVPVLDSYHGPARIAACTVSYERSGDQRTIVIADTPEGARCPGTSTDAGLAARAMREELIGTSITIDGQTIHP